MTGLSLPARPKILVYVELDLVGDGLIKLPFVRALRRAYPQSELTWLAGKGASAYQTTLSPLVNRLLNAVIDNAGIGNGAGELLGRPLPEQDFDLVIDTQRRVLTTLIVKRIRATHFLSGNADFFFSDVKPLAGYRRPRALVRELLDLVMLVSGRPVEALPPLPLDPAMEALAARLLPIDATKRSRYVALAPGTGGVPNRWPLQNFVTVASSLAQNGRVPVLLLGPEEQGWHENLAAAVHDACFPLQHPAARAEHFRADLTVALARRCTAGVAADSGGGHLMAAAGIPLVSLFGPTDPEQFAPYTQQLTVLRAQRWGGEAMDKIPPVAVLQAVEELLLG